MEEKMLEPIKYNWFQKIQKRRLIRKLNKNKDLNAWEKSKLKDDIEVMEIAWNLAGPEQYKEFPIGFQIEKAHMYRDRIHFFSIEVQLKLFEIDRWFSKDISDEALQFAVKKDPLCFSLLDQSIQNRVIQQTEFIQKNMGEFPNNIQRIILLKRPEMILYCSKEIKEDVLRKKDLSSPEWQICLSNEKNLTLPKLFNYLKYCNRNNVDMNRKAIADFCNSTEDKQEIVNFFHNRKINEQEDYFFIEMHRYFNKDTELALFDELTEAYFRHDTYTVSKRFRIETIQNKFISRELGAGYYSRYKDIIDGITEFSNADRIFNFMFREGTIIRKVDPEKVINYIKMLDEYSRHNKVIKDKKPISGRIYRKKLNAMFAEIITEAFGEKAGDIIKNRPGINLNDIPNTEVFTANIVENFRSGFVNDLLSYNFAGLDRFIKLAQDSNEIKAFKLYYEIMSRNLGENAVTMQLCISNYPKFQTILKEASNTELSDEQITQIESLCSWPANICGIKHLDELENLEERLAEDILKEREWPEQYKKDREISGVTIGNGTGGVNVNISKYTDYNFFRQNIGSEAIIFDYKNLKDDEIAYLSEEEKLVFKFFQQQKNFNISDIQILRKAKEEGIPLSSIFINQYTARTKVKKEQMKKFGEQLVDKKKIEQAAEEGKDGVKIISIDGVELIDLGTMPAYLISHDPDKDQSGVSNEAKDKDNYMYYDGMEGVSTISAYYGDGDSFGGKYVFWDFKDNEIIGFKMMCRKNGKDEHDADTLHGKKLVVSAADSNRTIKDYSGYANKETGEIAFYRRKREHSKEEGMFAGKFAPDAIISMNIENIIASQIRFGHPIPILVERGSLSKEEKIMKYREMIKKAKEEISKMKEEEIQEGKIFR